MGGMRTRRTQWDAAAENGGCAHPPCVSLACDFSIESATTCGVQATHLAADDPVKKVVENGMRHTLIDST